MTGRPLERSSARGIGSLEAVAARYLAQGGSRTEMLAAIERASQKHAGSLRAAMGRAANDPANFSHDASQPVEHAPASDQRRERSRPFAAPPTMVYQPIVALADQTIVGAEALARFPASPKQAPAAWFAQPRTVDLRVELELDAVRKAMQAIAKMPAGTFLSVNVSPDALAAAGFHALVKESKADRLVAEVTEHAPIRDYDRLSSVIGGLRALGMRLAVDDVGAGFASLQHILKLAPDFIKLDLTLIRNIQEDRSKQALAAGLISFAERSGATIIAEGIERAAEARALTDLGVRYGQGYYIGRPKPLPLRSSAPPRATRAVAQHVAR